MGLYGYCFSGLLPLLSHLNSPPLGVCFRESLVSNRLHSKIDQIHLSIEASVAQPVYLWMTATPTLQESYCFSGLLPLISHLNSPPLGVCFRESLVSNRLHSKIDQIHLSIEASVAQPVNLWVTATPTLQESFLEDCVYDGEI